MKKIALLSIAILTWLPSWSQKIEWADFVFSSANFNFGKGVVTDASGNVYVLGEIQDPITIQSNPFTNQYGSVDLILIKFNSQGNFMQAKVFGGTGSDKALDLAMDDVGNLYAASYIQGTTNMSDTVYNAGVSNQLIQFDTLMNFKRYIARPNDIVVDANGTDVYVACNNIIEKLDTALNLIWNRTASPAGLTFSDYGPQGGNGTIMVDDYGHLAVSGYENGTAPSVMLDTVTLKFGPGADNELFVMSMDTSGAALWGKTLDSSTTVQELYPKVAVDSSGNIYLAFYSQGDPIYFANDTLFNTAANGYGALLKYDASGNPQWGIGYYASTPQVDINDILINPQQEVLICGHSTGQIQFANYFQPAAGIELNPYVAKVNSNGVVQWFKSDSNTDFSTSNFQSIALTPAGGYAATGFYPPVSPGGYHIGCFLASPTGRDILTVVISENQEPVPATGFTVLQAASRILFKDTTQNVTSVLWNFGDASTSTFREPIHTYAQPGVYNVCLTATNNCGSSQHCETVTVQGLRAIVSNKGSNTGVMTADVLGGGFTPTTTVLLKRASNPNIVPYSITYINAGKLEVRLDLTGQPLGLWDVEVTVPGDTVMTLVNGFTIDSSSYSFDVTFGGPNPGKYNTWLPSQFIVHNRSNEDAVGVIVYYRIQDSVSSFVNTSFIPPSQLPFLNTGYQYLVSNALSTSLVNHTFSDTSTNSSFGAFIIPLLKANSSYVLPLYIKSVMSITFPKFVLASAPMLESSSLTGNYSANPDNCFGEFLKQAIENTFSITIADLQWNACFPPLYDSLNAAVFTQASGLNNNAVPISFPAAVVSMLTSMASSGCITGIPSLMTDAEIQSVITKSLRSVADTSEIDNILSTCSDFSGMLAPSEDRSPLLTNTGISLGGWAVFLTFALTYTVFAFPPGFMFILVLGTIVMALNAAVDPNHISGPGNNADDIFLKSGENTSYTITFENVDSATAPANVVIITDTLDGLRYDFGTFSFGPITIGDSLKYEFDEPEEHTQIKLSSLAPANPNYLRTEAVFDSTTGIIRWIFTTVDPVNFQPDTISVNGFLPPNLNGTEGTGHVTYSVRLKTSLVTGDTITNRATILFDQNAAIITNTWLNVIDIDKPQSAVNALPPQTSTASFLVSWAGSDFIAGIRAYNIYVSVNDQPYELWLPAVDTNQYTFNGTDGNKYEFVSIAMDSAGNIEAAPLDPENNPDAVTLVVVGIEENNASQNFNIGTNPFNDFLDIFVLNSVSGKIHYKLADVTGKITLSGNVESKPGSSFRIETKELNSGIYFVTMINEDYRKTFKAVKMK